MTYTVPVEIWADLVKLSKQKRETQDMILGLWQKTAEVCKFTLATMRIVDDVKGIVEAEPPPNPEYVRQKQILMMTDVLHRLPPEDRKVVTELAEITPKLTLAHQLRLVQEGANAADAVQAEPQEIPDNEIITADFGNAEEGERPN